MFVAWSTCNCIIAHVVDTHIVSLTLLPECLSLCGVQWHSTPADILHVTDNWSQTTWPPYSPYCTSVNRTCCESSLWVCRDCSLRECAMTLWSSGVCRYCRLRECGATIVFGKVSLLSSVGVCRDWRLSNDVNSSVNRTYRDCRLSSVPGRQLWPCVYCPSISLFIVMKLCVYKIWHQTGFGVLPNTTR